MHTTAMDGNQPPKSTAERGQEGKRSNPASDAPLRSALR